MNRFFFERTQSQKTIDYSFFFYFHSNLRIGKTFLQIEERPIVFVCVGRVLNKEKCEKN